MLPSQTEQVHQLVLKGQLGVLLLHARQVVSKLLHVSQQNGRHYHSTLSVALLAAVVLELTRSPDTLGATRVLLRTSDESQQLTY